MVICETSPRPCLFGIDGESTLLERNTFLEYHPPEPPELCRSSTDPGSVSSLSASRSAAAEEKDKEEDRTDTPLLPPLLPPPPQLELEAFETYDSFEDPIETSSSMPGESSTAAGANAPGDAGYCWRASPDSGHGFQSPFMTSPGAAHEHVMMDSPEDRVIYEWCDSPQRFTFNDPAAHLTPGERAEQLFLPPPGDMALAMPSELLHASMVPPPPFSPAPCIEPPSSPHAPSSAPGNAPGDVRQSEPEAPASDATALEIARQPSGITCTVFGSIHHVAWQVDARKLESQDKQAVSPQFVIALPALGPQPFKIALYPKITSDSKRGASFKKAKGKGKVVLKCEAQLPQNVPEIGFRIGVGRGDKLQMPRGPVAHNFSEQSMRGLAKPEEEWDFNSAVDESGMFVVSIAFAQSVALLATPYLCSPMLRSQ